MKLSMVATVLACLSFPAIASAEAVNNVYACIHNQEVRIVAVAVGSAPSAIAEGDGSVWVANSESGTVSRIQVP